MVKVRGSQLDALEARGSKRVKLARHVVTHLGAIFRAHFSGHTSGTSAMATP